jgi:hypothetical protein
VDSALEQKKIEARKLLEKRATPKNPLHTVIGAFTERKTRGWIKDNTANA